MTNPSAVSSGTIHFGSVICIAKALKSLDLDATRIFQEAGLKSLEPIEPDDRVSTAVLANVLSRATEETDRAALLGIRFASYIHATSYQSFSLMLIACPTLRHFCKRIEQYFAYMNSVDKISFVLDGELAHLSYAPRSLNYNTPEEAIAQSSGMIASLLQLIRMAYHPDYSPYQVTFNCQKPVRFIEEFESFFNCPLIFNSELTTISFPTKNLDSPLPGGNPELSRRSELFVSNYLQSIGFNDFGNLIRIKLFELLPQTKVQMQCVAESLDMSENQLSAVLKKQNLKYNTILDDTRRELAEEYMARHDLSINEIAYMLGFTDSSNFSRKFRRWTGLSPSAFKEMNSN